MPKILQLSPHIANLIAAGEVVERPASVIKELMENAVDAGASRITVEIRDGGMTFMRVTDNGCGMSPEDAETAFLRHATSKLRRAEDLAEISTMGFRGEALAAIASVSRIELMTKTPGAVSGTGITLEGGKITERTETGCPDGTTVLVRNLFFNTPARMKFMKSDSVEAGRISAAVQMQALAHPDVAVCYLRDGKQVLSTPGNGSTEDAAYCVFGKASGISVPVNSHWENYRLTGFLSKPTDARPSRNMQTFFVNGRPVRSKLLTAALEEAYRNRIMVGKFPACVLYLTVPVNAVDVNVHPAKTEVKFLNEKAVFDCVNYGVLGALNQTADRPKMQFGKKEPEEKPKAVPQKQETFFRTMTAQEYRDFSKVVSSAPTPDPAAAKATIAAVDRVQPLPLRETVILPEITPPKKKTEIPETVPPVEETALPVSEDIPEETPPMPWRMVGELFNTYIVIEQGENAFLIDKHAAHERILFDKLKAKQDGFSSQSLISPVPCRLPPESIGVLLDSRELLEELGFGMEEFGDSTLLLRRVPMDLGMEEAVQTLEAIAADLRDGKAEKKENVRDDILHTVACKAAIKAGWHTDPAELQVLAAAVMERDDLKYCPHGRPICITLTEKQLEKQFKRT